MLPLPDWLPPTCAEGHPYAAGVSLSWVFCDCPGAGGAHGHHVVYDRINGCHAPAVYPPEHTGEARSQR
jgi:hypothetical protein